MEGKLIRGGRELTSNSYAVSRMRTDHHCASLTSVTVHDGFSRRPPRLAHKPSGQSRTYRWTSPVSEYRAQRVRPAVCGLGTQKFSCHSCLRVKEKGHQGGVLQ
jgi:hypothetical protein